LGQPTVRFRDPGLYRFDTAQGCGGQTTDIQTPKQWLRRAKHYMLSRIINPMH